MKPATGNYVAGFLCIKKDFTFCSRYYIISWFLFEQKNAKMCNKVNTPFFIHGVIKNDIRLC